MLVEEGRPAPPPAWGPWRLCAFRPGTAPTSPAASESCSRAWSAPSVSQCPAKFDASATLSTLKSTAPSLTQLMQGMTVAAGGAWQTYNLGTPIDSVGEYVAKWMANTYSATDSVGPTPATHAILTY